MPRGVADSPETRAFIIGLHVEGRSLSELSGTFASPREVLSRWWQRYQRDGCVTIRVDAAATTSNQQLATNNQLRRDQECQRLVDER